MLITRGWHDSSRQKEQGEKGQGTIALLAKWHVEELKNPHKKCLFISLNPQELGDCRLALVAPRGVDYNSPKLFSLTFISKYFPVLANILAKAETDWGGCFSLHTPNQNQTKPNQSMVGSAPAASVLIRWLCVWSVSVCVLNTIMLLPNLHGNSQTDKNMFALILKGSLFWGTQCNDCWYLSQCFRTHTEKHLVKKNTSCWFSHCWLIGWEQLCVCVCVFFFPCQNYIS